MSNKSKTTTTTEATVTTTKQKGLLKLDAVQQAQYDKLKNKSQRIRYLRLILKKSRSEIALFMGIVYQFVRNIEIVTNDKDLQVVKDLIK